MNIHNENVKVGDKIKVYESTFEDQNINEELAEIINSQGYLTVSEVNKQEFNTYVKVEEDKYKTVSLYNFRILGVSFVEPNNVFFG